MLALLLLAQTELDPPATDKQKRIAAIEARTEHTIPSAASLTIAAGDTVLVQASLPVDDARGVLDGRPSGVRAGRGIAVAPWIEVVEQKPGAIVVVYAVAVAPDHLGGTDELEGTIEIANKSGKIVAKKTFAHDLTIERPNPTPDAIALDREAYLHHQGRALDVYRFLDRLEDSLRLDRFSRPPELARVPEAALSEFRTFLHHRLRAEAAKRRLIAAARADDPALELAAIHAIGSLSKAPTGPAKQAHAIENLTTDDALALARKSLGQLMIDEAEGMLLKLRNSGRLQKKELARALELMGAVRLARSDDEGSERAFGQALCADPGLESILERRAFADAFAHAKAKSPCREPIHITEVHVFHDQGDHSLVYRVTATYAEDPFGLVEGGDLQIWGSGGAMFAADKPRSTENKQVVGTIADTGNMETYAGQILVKVFLRDRSGVVIDSYGDPDPISLPIERGANLPSVSIPWWVWVVAAGVVVAGAATTTAILLTRDDGEPPLGIGPIEVTF